MTNDLSVNGSPVRVKRGCSSFLDPTCKFNVVFIDVSKHLDLSWQRYKVDSLTLV